MFGLGRLLYVAILLLNSVAILSEERFIARLIGDETPAFGQSSEEGFKTRLLSLIRSIRTVTRPVLIGANILVVAYELILG